MITKHDDIMNILRKAAKAGLNVLIEGTHGTGKTSLITQVARELGLSMKYYSTATLDPFVDLVGLPVPGIDAAGHPGVIYHRPRDIDQADLVFFDEFNRAQPKTLNAVLEIVQFHTINGEPLPRLKAVFAACNPVAKDYDVVPLDAALVDRFHVCVRFEPGPDLAWFRTRFNEELATALCDWFHTDLDMLQQQSVSPRKLEHIGQLILEDIDPQQALHKDDKLPFRLLKQRIKAGSDSIDIKDILAAPQLFARKVAANMNVAFRVAHLVARMKPAQMAQVQNVILALPHEVLMTLSTECPFVFRKTEEGLLKTKGKEDADLFRDILNEQLGELAHDRKGKPDSKRTEAA